MDVGGRGLAALELLSAEAALGSEHNPLVRGFDDDRLVARRMPRCGQKPDPVGEFLIAVHEPEAVIGDASPLGDGLARCLRGSMLGVLHVDRRGQGVLLAAVVEVQVRQHHRFDVG
jgi:hypothetical protein